MSDEPTTPAGRVQRYRAQYGDVPWTIHQGTEADHAARQVTTENALAALDGGDAAEAAVWANLALLASYRFRKVT